MSARFYAARPLSDSSEAYFDRSSKQPMSLRRLRSFGQKSPFACCRAPLTSDEF
jgi:hypothetical protein